MKRPASLILVVAPFVLALAACGGGGGGSSAGGDVSGSSGGSGGVTPATATGTMTVVWPPRSRLIPAAANSLVVKLSLAGTVVAQQVIARPTSGNSTNTTFTGLPVGTLAVSVSAAPNSDGTGQAQAVGTGSMVTAIGVPGAVTVSLVSTVATLSVTPSPLNMGQGMTSTVTAAAQDSSGNIVLLSAGGGTETLTWTSDTPSIATVTGTGPTASVHAIANGSASIHATFTTDDSGTTVGGSTSASVVSTSGTVTIH